MATLLCLNAQGQPTQATQTNGRFLVELHTVELLVEEEGGVGGIKHIFCVALPQGR